MKNKQITVSVRLSSEEYTRLTAAVDRLNRVEDRPPTNATAIMRWQLLAGKGRCEVIHKSRWLTRLVMRLPRRISYIERVRVGQDTSTYVELHVFGVSLGIWRAA